MSLTPDVSRKVGMGLSPSPFYTPRPDKRRSDFSSNTKHSNTDRDREVNVQVLVRCRPLTESNLPKAVSCDEHKREVTVATKQIDRLFTFDKVFGPKSQQRSIYDQAIAPIVNEVLDGFNCTVFAYGQTGTGKTYTMEGGIRNKGGELGAEAGMIPRAVRHMFETLESQKADYSVKVTFSELYNEEITDLLCDDSRKRPISLMEDGKGCVMVRGLEEEAVYNVNEIYTLLERGSAKRRASDTLLNKRSSRSHSIFSITVHIKEPAVGDEELIKCGKLNLVDLAGSENISRSGARESRAREAGEINKSLLTLGRVINTLVEHSSHVPYRDSKLTRLLRDSLGGKTKTCIIATISPSALCLEETLSTLDYAYRAKNIRNKPEANQKMAKTVLLKDLYLELERMKEDVRAAREKNGVYVPQERFAQDEDERKAKNEKIQLLENNLVLAEKEVNRFRELYLTEQEQKLDIQSDLKDCKMSLGASNKALLDLQENYRVAISSIKEKESEISNLLSSENSLVECVKGLRKDLLFASEDINSLLTRLDEKEDMETTNQNLVLKFGSQLDQSLKDLHKTVIGSVSQQKQQIWCMEETLSTYLARKNDLAQALESRVNKMRETYKCGVEGLKELVSLIERKASSELNHINATISSRATFVENFISSVVTDANDVISDIQNSVNEQKQILDFYTNQQEEGIKRSLVSAKMISSATTEFFSEVHDRASQVDRLLEENQYERCQQLKNMEMALKEEYYREEREAVENIAAILANMTAKRIATVSEASRKMLESDEEEKKRLVREMHEIRHLTVGATKEMSAFLDATENDSMDNTFSVAQHRTFADDCITHCAERAERSKQQWGNMHSSVKSVNEKIVADIQSTIEENISTNEGSREEFICTCLNVDSEFNAAASETLETIKDSVKEEKENKEEMERLSCVCLEELSASQENHGKRVAKMRSEAEKCIRKDYMMMVGSEAPKAMKRSYNEAAAVPSLASIEEMRSDARSGTKTIPQPLIRTPFTDVLNNQLNK